MSHVLTPEELSGILRKHGLWIEGKEGGELANLSGSNLSYSDLSGSNLSGSNLRGSNLSGSNLRGSNLSGSDLSGSNLSYSNLSGSDLSGSNLSYSDLSYSDLSGSIGLPNVRPVPDLAKRILEEFVVPKRLRMATFHGDATCPEEWCCTTHCMAGSAIVLHPAGPELESIYGPAVAGTLIFRASIGEVPNFYDTEDGAEERAEAWLRERSDGESNAALAQ